MSGEGEEYKEEGGYQEREEGGDIWMAYVEVDFCFTEFIQTLFQIFK